MRFHGVCSGSQKQDQVGTADHLSCQVMDTEACMVHGGWAKPRSMQLQRSTRGCCGTQKTDIDDSVFWLAASLIDDDIRLAEDGHGSFIEMLTTQRTGQLAFCVISVT